MRAAVLVNRSAGSVVRSGLTAEEIGAAFAAAGVEAEVRFLPGAEIAAAARAAVRNGFGAVVAAGGDGTIRCVAGVLADGGAAESAGGRTVPLGVLPVGTLNHFARDLGIPLDLKEAAAVVTGGRVHRLDLGEVNGEIFVNNSMLGFYPPVVRERDRQRRHLGRGKWWATISALAKVVPRLPALRLRIETAGQTLERTTRFVFVGNNEYVMHAFRFGARGRLDSGDLYLYVADAPDRSHLVRLALLSLVRDLKAAERFEAWRLPEVTIDLVHPARTIAVYMDGEVEHLAPPLCYRVRPRALPVLLPAAAPR